ncbi:MAG: hypothetical protein K8H87_03265 [Pseudorhodoplanes sp.]|nr:hypothetical protein [Pseudorhodoplanes sp.]
MDAFAAATDALFADPNIARDAVWRVGGAGAGIAVRVVTRRPDQVVSFGDSRAIVPAVLIDVRRAEVAEPAIGDTVEIEGETFKIIATPVADSLRLVWSCEAALKA